MRVRPTAVRVFVGGGNAPARAGTEDSAASARTHSMATSPACSPAFPPWLPEDVTGTVCLQHCLGACHGPCERIHFVQQSLALLLSLRHSGRLTPEASQAICRLGLETIDDIAFAFSSPQQAEEHALGHIWAYAQTGAAAEAVRLARKTILELNKAATPPSGMRRSIQLVIAVFRPSSFEHRRGSQTAVE